jgi:hypothetical protein
MSSRSCSFEHCVKYRDSRDILAIEASASNCVPERVHAVRLLLRTGRYPIEGLITFIVIRVDSYDSHSCQKLITALKRSLARRLQ